MPKLLNLFKNLVFLVFFSYIDPKVIGTSKLHERNNMKPLKPIKPAAHNTAKVHVLPMSKLVATEPLPTTKDVPVTIDTVDESFARLDNTKPLAERARFDELRFSSKSLYLISNDGWKGHTLDVSLRLAHHFAYVKKCKTLYLNCIVDKVAVGRKFKSLVGNKHVSNGLLQLATMLHGEGGTGISTLVEAIARDKIEVVILNSWEWAAFSKAEKRKLFRSFDWLSEVTSATVVIFTSAKVETISAGNYRKGLIGFLADIAEGVIDLRKENALLPTLYNDDLTIPTDDVKPVYMTTPDEKKDEGGTTGAIKTNDLEQVVGTSIAKRIELVPA